MSDRRHKAKSNAAAVIATAVALLLPVAPTLLMAQQATFRSALLARLAKHIAYTPLDTLTAGCYPAATVLGKQVVATYDDRHTVTNLGFALFNPEIKQAYSSHVYDFIERYFLELCCWEDKATLKQKMKDDKVMFTHGNMADIGKIDFSSPFSISRTDDKFYEVTWTRDGATLLSMAFPIQYELFLGMPVAEIEKTLYDRITTAAPYEELPAAPQCEPDENGIYRTAPRRYYELESVNNCSYYYRKTDGTYILVQDTVSKLPSVINLFHHITRADNPMRVEQRLYGFKTTNFTVTLRQWLNYCHQERLQVYTGMEEEYADGVKLLVIAENRDMGYNHLLSVIVPYACLTNPKVEMKVVANAYIPTHNVKTLYDTYIKKTKKKTY